MTIGQALSSAILQFKKYRITSANIDAEVILSFVSGKNKEFIYAHPECKLKISSEKKLLEAIKRRCRYEPVAYIVGHKEFYGLDLCVDKNVLIPRPETELLIEEIIKSAKNYQTPTIADIGTGSGAIAIALKKYLPRAKIIALDKSSKALNVAKLNAKKNKTKIKFIQGDLLQPLKLSHLDIIVANLPYLPNSDHKTSNPEHKFLKHEPKIALYGGEKGFELYLKLFQQIIRQKISFDYLICEIDYRHAVELKTIAKKYFPDKKISLIKDLNQRNRFLKIEI